MGSIEGVRGIRRVYPRFWDYCAYMLRRLRDALMGILDAELTMKRGAVVVDYGCGEKPYKGLVNKHEARYIGIDLAGNPEADVTCDSNGRIPLESEFADIVLSIQVLEHVPDITAYLTECLRVLKPGGLLVLSTHGVWVYHPYPQDVRRWTCWGLKYDIERHGFLVESEKGCVGPLAYTTQLRLQLARGALWKFRPVTTPVIHCLSAIAQVLMALEDLITPRIIREQNSAIFVLTARKPNRRLAADKPFQGEC